MISYQIFITPAAYQEIKDAPGNIRQRIKRAIEGLRKRPRPPASKGLSVEGAALEFRRLRLERWRIVYSIDEEGQIIDVLAIRKRPPYDYGDLARLAEV